jgi:hypothetical protein
VLGLSKGKQAQPNTLKCEKVGSLLKSLRKGLEF